MTHKPKCIIKELTTEKPREMNYWGMTDYDGRMELLKICMKSRLEKKLSLVQMAETMDGQTFLESELSMIKH